MTSETERYERLTDRGLSGTQLQAIAWVPPGSRVLELGCSTGFVGERLIKERHCRVTGVELDPRAAAAARQRGLEMLVGSLEDDRLRAAITGPFDVVMATDVLEHLRDPERVLADIRRWVAPDGRAIVAVPNIAVWSMRVALLRGEFNYEETGLCDRTHLRFFTRDTLHEMVRRGDWRVEAEMVDAWEVPGLQQLLYQGPLHIRERFPETAGRPWRNRLTHGAGRMLRAHRWLGSRLGARWPNLCGDHFALLLRPDEAR